MSLLDSYEYNQFLQKSKTLGGTKQSEADHVHLSFGFPYTDLFPLQEISDASQKAVLKQGHLALHYYGGPSVQYLPEWVGGRLQRIGIDVPTEQIRILSGATQAIEIVSRILINSGDEVWTENPSFFGATRIFKLAGATIRSFEMDGGGIMIDPLRKELESRRASGQAIPKFIYVMPNYQNPTGITLTEERRRALAKLAKAYGFYILEDDAYVELNFTENWLPAIYTYAPEHVIHIGSFSKIIGPGVRLGWAIASPKLQRYIQQFMGGSETNPLMQEIISTFLQEHHFDDYLNRVIDCYKQHLKLMVNALHQEFGNDIDVDIPSGGFFLCIRFKQDIDVKKLSAEANHLGVSVVDGSAFYLNQEGRGLIRLCFTYCSPQQILQGIERLRQAYDKVRN